MTTKLTTYIENKSQLDILQIIGVREVIICTSRLSRFSKLTMSESLNLAKEAAEMNITPVLEWDILMTQDQFHSIITLLDGLDLSVFKSIRVRDQGAAEYILNKKKDLRIQLLLEYGNHNLLGIKEWITYLKPSIERVILSIEISKNHLKKYIEEIDIEVEVMGIGRIPLFYSPRSLISHAIDEAPSEIQKIYKASSEESPHRGFDLIENAHGILMFNTKDYGPLKEWSELISMKLSVLRIDFRHIDNQDVYANLMQQVSHIFQEENLGLRLEMITKLKEDYGRPLIKGFFGINKSNVLFKKLKNSRTKRFDDLYLGEVVEVNKGIHIGVSIKSGSVKLGDKIKLLTPDGKEKYLTINNMTNSRLDEIKSAAVSELVFFKHLGGISVKTQVYLEEEI